VEHACIADRIRWLRVRQWWWVRSPGRCRCCRGGHIVLVRIIISYLKALKYCGVQADLLLEGCTVVLLPEVANYISLDNQFRLSRAIYYTAVATVLLSFLDDCRSLFTFQTTPSRHYSDYCWPKHCAAGVPDGYCPLNTSDVFGACITGWGNGNSSFTCTSAELAAATASNLLE
jgi:hypothetical protein